MPDNLAEKRELWEEENALLAECVNCGQPSAFQEINGRKVYYGLCPEHLRVSQYLR